MKRLLWSSIPEPEEVSPRVCFWWSRAPGYTIHLDTKTLESTRHDTDEESMENHRLTTLGSLLIVLGVSVWGVYAVCRWGFGWEVSGRHFLGFHLAGVIPGSILKRRFLFNRLFK